MSGTHASSPTRYYGAQAVNTTFAEETQRGTGAYHVVTSAFTTASGTAYVVAPCDGLVSYAVVTCLETTDGTHKFKLTITNLNGAGSSKVIMAETEYAASTITATVPYPLTLTATSTARTVNQGDLITVAYVEDGGATITGVTLTMYFENIADAASLSAINI